MADVNQALNRLAKWRTVFAGWQLGTRSKEDPECQAVRDHREATILLRVELSALSMLLIKKGLFTQQEWTDQLVEEAEHLNQGYEQLFPGCRATDVGMQIDQRAAAWMKDWRP